MAKIFNVPFATIGNREEIPQDAQSDNAVSYATGYTPEYALDPATDPSARDIERTKFNSLMHAITEAVFEMQRHGVALWSADAAPYPIKARVYHDGAIWSSAVGNNNQTPGAGANWEQDVIGVISFNGRSGVVSPQAGDYNKSQVGLGNVDNTSDANKPISTATQTALNTKADQSDLVALTGRVGTAESDISDLEAALDTKSAKLAAFNSAATSNTTLGSSHLDKINPFNTNSGDIIFQIPTHANNPLPIGSVATVLKTAGANTLIVRGANGVILQSPGMDNKTGPDPLYIRGANSVVTLVKRQNDLWLVFGAVIEES